MVASANYSDSIQSGCGRVSVDAFTSTFIIVDCLDTFTVINCHVDSKTRYCIVIVKNLDRSYFLDFVGYSCLKSIFLLVLAGRGQMCTWDRMDNCHPGKICRVQSCS